MTVFLIYVILMCIRILWSIQSILVMFCTCKHHTLVSETCINPYFSFEKLWYASWSTLIGHCQVNSTTPSNLRPLIQISEAKSTEFRQPETKLFFLNCWGNSDNPEMTDFWIWKNHRLCCTSRLWTTKNCYRNMNKHISQCLV